MITKIGALGDHPPQCAPDPCGQNCKIATDRYNDVVQIGYDKHIAVQCVN